MPLDRAQHGVGIPILHGHDAPRVGELVEHGVEAPDMIVKQKSDGTAGVPANLEFVEHAHDVVDCRLALTSRAGGEQNQAWMRAPT